MVFPMIKNTETIFYDPIIMWFTVLQLSSTVRLHIITFYVNLGDIAKMTIAYGREH